MENMSVTAEFLRVSGVQMETMLARIETCAAKLTEEQIWTRYGENQNAVGNLVLHLTGNVRQWILSGVGGAADVRVRDAEFAARGSVSAAELMAGLRRVVEAAVAVIRGLSEQDMLTRISVQGYDVTKLEAVYHVVEHFTGHAFQIIFATKLLTDTDLGFYAHLNP
jgi:uncharacterized damage-inducible protein DinB